MAKDLRPRTYQLASLFLALSGVIHIAGGVMNITGHYAAQLVAIGVAFLVTAYLMQAGRRWMAYFIFPVMCMVAAIAYALYSGSTALADLFYLGIIASNLLCVLVLFYALWRRKLTNT